MKLVIIGTGYLGLVTGACFAHVGHNVTCVDIDQQKIALLKSGRLPFFEPGLEEVVKKNCRSHLLSFTTDYMAALQDADACFIAVSTPSTTSGECDLSAFMHAIEAMAKAMQADLLIIIKSTVPVGTAKSLYAKIQHILSERAVSFSFDIVSNPEFLREGSSLHDCLHPDRIVLGGGRPEALECVRSIYAPFNFKEELFLMMDHNSAELTKYAANAMLACRLSFMNELASISEALHANILFVKEGIGMDCRIGKDYLQPGIGFGGSCLPKDLRALKCYAKESGIVTPLLEAIERVNEKQRFWPIKKLEDYFQNKGGLEGRTLALWGISFKAGTDDLREAPALLLIQELLNRKIHLNLYDPIALPKIASLFSKEREISLCKTADKAAQDADGILLITDWEEFRRLNLEEVRQEMRGGLFLDGRCFFDPEAMIRLGFDYFAVGYNPQEAELILSAADSVLSEIGSNTKPEFE